MSATKEPRMKVGPDGTPYIEAGRLRIEVVSDARAETVAFVVCAPPAYAMDATDIRTTCADCQTPIVHRPHAPVRPPKLCLACASRRLRATGGGHAPLVTAPTAEDLDRLDDRRDES